MLPLASDSGGVEFLHSAARISLHARRLFSRHLRSKIISLSG
jgi:hypothetical protein